MIAKSGNRFRTGSSSVAAAVDSIHPPDQFQIRSSDDRSGFVDTADDAAELEDSDFDNDGDIGFDDTDYACSLFRLDACILDDLGIAGKLALEIGAPFRGLAGDRP